MASGFTIRKNQYFDSVYLMGINNRLSSSPGVIQTAVLMGTEKNKQLLIDMGINVNEIETAGANDLIAAVTADSKEAADAALSRLDALLSAEVEESISEKLRTLQEGLDQKPDANLAVISIPGEFAYREALEAIEAGLNVFIFSSNVPLEEELDLKKKASEKGLLVMGPDCGTSLIGGKGIGFANAVRKGSIGVIGASGTGLQEFSCQIHHAGLGISHAIGTGTNDVTDQIGGITSILAVDALEADPATELIAFISKPPGKQFQEDLIKRLQLCSKPCVCCFLGAEKAPQDSGKIHFTSTIDEAVQWSRHLVASGPIPEAAALTQEELKLAASEAAKLDSSQRYLRGIFAGGTFTYQSQKVLQGNGFEIYSNAPLQAEYRLEDPDRSKENSIVDMGDEHYTLRRPHPMIDGTLRKERIKTESSDPQMAFLLMDFILGYNSSPDPAGELLNAIDKAQQSFRERDAHLVVVASICGTENDPQDLELQSQLLRDQGVIVFNSNCRAAAFCAALLSNQDG